MQTINLHNVVSVEGTQAQLSTGTWTRTCTVRDIKDNITVIVLFAGDKEHLYGL